MEQKKSLTAFIQLLKTVIDFAQTHLRREAGHLGRQLIKAAEAADRQRNAEILNASLPTSVKKSLPEPIEPETALAESHEQKAEPEAETAQADLDVKANEVGEKSEEGGYAETAETGVIESETALIGMVQAENIKRRVVCNPLEIVDKEDCLGGLGDIESVG